MRAIVNKLAGLVQGIGQMRTYLTRRVIARLYLRGDGIEIGALSHPLKVPRKARVKYVDRFPVPELRRAYPELGSVAMVEVDIVDDGERLSRIEDASLDFCIANHFLEHCENPIGAVRNMLRVLRDEGILYLAIPDKRYTFDIDRPVTSLEHLVEDDRNGPAQSRREHYEEYTRLVDHVQGEEAERHTARLMDSRASIHFHVWTGTEMLELVLALKKMIESDFSIELVLRHANEVVFVLRKAQVSSLP
jgi:SAM-dependent methyltransferase